MFSATLSPSKGKGKDGVAPAAWRTGWWDFVPLIESSRRPVQWSSSSILLTAHPVHPTVIARHFASSKQFALPPPTPIATSVASYEPPSTILIHPGGDFLFAFFPGRQVDGVGCLWRRGFTIDMWVPLKWWSFPAGAGVVTGQWLGAPRCYAESSLSGSHRLPPQGPRISVGDVSLLLVSEDHHVYLIFNRHYSEFRVMKCPLLHPMTVIENQSSVPPPPHSEAIPFRQCVAATIGLHYSDSSIFVAFRSRSAPIPHTTSSVSDVPTNVDQVYHSMPCELEPLGDEPEINICQITIQLRNALILLSTKPLHTIDKMKDHVSQMTFFSFLPKIGGLEPSAPPSLLFGLSLLRMGDYDASPVRSCLQLYNLIPQSLSTNPALPKTWTVEPSVSRFIDGALSFVFPVAEAMDSPARLLYAGILDTSSGMSRTYNRRKEVAVGMTKVLNVSDLSDNHQWESTPMWSSSQRYGVPSSAAISPNQKQVWTASFSLWHSQTTVHALPRPHRQSGRKWPEGIELALAVLSRKSISDIVHSISISSLSSEDVIEIIQTAFRVLQESQQYSKERFLSDMIGITFEVYRTRAKHCEDRDARTDLTDRWQVARDMLSVAACRLAFEESTESFRYETPVAWSLVKLASWVIDLVKTLVKNCVLSLNTLRPNSQAAGDDLFGSTPNYPLTNAESDSILTHLVHPFALGNLATVLNQIQQFRTSLDNAPTNDENFLLARNVLVDLIDFCPIKISEFSILLGDAKEEIAKLDIATLNETLASCRPTVGVQGHLWQTIKKITESESLLDRARLFIGPADLLDGVSRLSLRAQPKPKDVDVITKDALQQKHTWLCLRCGGKFRASQGATQVQKGGKLWEKRWFFRCTCGGYWLRP